MAEEKAVVVSFKTNISTLVELRNKQEKLKLLMDKVKQKHNAIENDIVEFIEKNNLQDKKIVLNSSTFKYKNKDKLTPVTKKFVRASLLEYFNNDMKKTKEAMMSIYNTELRLKLGLLNYFKDNKQATEATNFILSRRESINTRRLLHKVKKD